MQSRTIAFKKLIFVILVISAILVLSKSAKRSYYKNDLSHQVLSRVNMIHLVRPLPGVGDCGTSEPRLIKQLISSTVSGIYHQVPFGQKFSDGHGVLEMIEVTKTGKIILWKCQFDLNGGNEAQYNPEFVFAIKNIVNEGSTYQVALLKASLKLRESSP